MLDLRRSLTFPFKDREWVGKMLIGSAFYLVPVLNFALNGYGLDVLRNTARGEDVPLPKWDDLGRHFVDGLKLLVVQLIYSIPLFAVAMLMQILAVGFGVSIEDVQRPMRESMTNGFGVMMVALFCVIMLYGLFVAFITPAAHIQIARSGEIKSAFCQSLSVVHCPCDLHRPYRASFHLRHTIISGVLLAVGAVRI